MPISGQHTTRSYLNFHHLIRQASLKVESKPSPLTVTRTVSVEHSLGNLTDFLNGTEHRKLKFLPTTTDVISRSVAPSLPTTIVTPDGDDLNAITFFIAPVTLWQTTTIHRLCICQFKGISAPLSAQASGCTDLLGPIRESLACQGVRASLTLHLIQEIHEFAVRSTGILS